MQPFQTQSTNPRRPRSNMLTAWYQECLTRPSNLRVTVVLESNLFTADLRIIARRAHVETSK